MPEALEPAPPLVCTGCGTEVAPRLLTCPSCQRLVHGERLKELAATAEAQARAGDLSAALSAWQEALTLLPAQSRQHQIISAKVAELGRQIDAAPRSARNVATSRGDISAKNAGPIAGLIAIVVFLATKAKFLLLGLTRSSTFLSMFLSVGVYWAAFGWQLALGLVISIYIHEMGHVAALMRYGIPASAPLFVPGIGAMIRLRQNLTDPRQDARVGLAGPLWGLGAALASGGVYLATKQPIWAAITQLGAWINLFNLMPIWQLDGGRAFHALSQGQRWIAAATVLAAWYAVSSIAPESQVMGLLLLIMIVAVFQAFAGKPARSSDTGTLALYMVLVATLTALSLVPVEVTS
jgi:Zn-dependent protease